MSSSFDTVTMAVFFLLLLYISSIYRSASLEEAECINREYRETYDGPVGADCDPDSGWECDYAPEFSHRDGDHAFCDLEVIQLDAE